MDIPAATQGQITQPAMQPQPPVTTPPSQTTPFPSSPSSFSPAPKSPSNVGLVVVISIVILIVLGVGAYAMMSKPSTIKKDIMEQSPSPTTMIVEPTPTVIPSMGMEEQNSSLTNGNTDAELDEDTATLDAQMNTSGTEVNKIDSGLNDQPGDLSE